MLKRTPRWTLLALLTICGCATEPSDAPVPDDVESPDPAAAERPSWLLGRAPWPAQEGIGVESNGGRYWVVYMPPEPEIPLNEEFNLEIRVFDAATRSWLVNAEMALDARMPAHGHGMKIEPTPVQNAEGGFDVPGMLLHMVGHWELYVDLTEGALTERAQFDIELE